MVSAEGPRVRLRLHHGGSFTQVPGEANWRYSMQDTAGSIFNVTLDATTTYADFVHICNTKVNCACSIKYQSPGEPLAPDSLVTVSDDDDLQELVNEYMDALQRPGTEQRTFRIHVFLTPALTFGIEPEEDGMDASLGCHDEQINYEDYCGDDYSSCDPSSDTAWQASQPGGSRAHPASASAAVAATGPPQLQQAGRGALVGMGLHGDSFLAVHHANTEPAPGVWGTAGMAGAGDAAGAWADGLATPRAEHEGGARLMGQPDVGHPLFTADDFHVEDPYMEEQSPVPAGLVRKERVFDGNTAAAAPGPGFTAGLHNDEAALPLSAKPLQLNGNASNGNHPALPEGVLGPGKAQNLRGTPLYSRPLSSRVRDAASGLPSHISAFGDGGSKGASLHLPSHISAFGDGTAQEGVDMATEDDAQPGEEPGMRAWDASRCITQEFPERTASMQHVSQASPEDNPGAGRGPMDKQGDHPASGSGAGCPPTPKVLEQAGAKVPRADVVQAVKIGEGAFGEVSCATVFPFGTVAIKWLKKDRFAKYSESFQREAEVLARLNHPHIIRMYGLVTESANSPPGSLAGSASAPVPGAGAGNGGTDGAQPQPPATANGPLVRSSSGVGGAGIIIAGIMMEYLKGGSLAQRFRALAQSGRRLSLRERCLIARQAALGMSYLHGQTPAVIHFDLKPDNLLLEGEGEAIIVKVADFGLSKHKIQSYVTCHDLRGTLPYMAPELVKCPNQVCEKCDVWSMGVVMWEMVTLEVPFQELTAQDILRGLMQGSLHLRMPATCEPEWQRLITSCMEPEPVKRPTFRQLTERLDDMFKRLPPASLQTVGSSGHASNGLTQQHQPQLVQPVPPPPQVLVQQPQQHVLVAAQQQQQQQQHVTAAAVLMQQLQRHQQMELEQQQQVAVAAVAPFAHLQAAQQAAAVAQQPVGFHGPLFTPLYAHPQQPSSSPHLPGFYGDTNGLFAADTAAVIGGYGADAKAAAMLDNLNLFGQLAGHGHGAPHGAALPAAAPLPNHHNPLAYGLTHCQVAAAHPQLMYQ